MTRAHDEGYARELRWLYGLSARGVRLELDRMRAGLRHRGHPERGLQVVHVAGTNGKGSVASFCERTLRAAGLRTGLFTSPHLHRFVERFRVNGRPLGEREVARRLGDLRAAAPEMPPLTFFEHSALLAFEAFRDHACDVVVLETGLGGRLDATNVVPDPLVSVITRIAYDHTNILGSELGQIAAEKAGILKRGRPAVIGARDPEARRVLLEVARRRRTDPWVIGREFDGVPAGVGRALVRVGDETQSLRLGLAGDHQAENAAIAVAAMHRLRAQGLEVSDEAISEGLAKARWPGRLERYRPPGGQRPRFLFDCAHNPDGCAALAEHLRAMVSGQRARGRVVLLFGALADKDYEAMLGSFDGLVDRRVYAIPKMPRAPESAAVFTAVRDGLVARSVREGVAKAERAAGPDGLVVVAGSIFLVQEARALVRELRADPSVGL